MEKREFLKNMAMASAGVVLLRPEAFASAPQVRKKNIRKAMFQETTARGIMCNICPNECILSEGEVSICRSRKVMDSELKTLSYGNPCALNIDPVEKKPLYHFLPGSKAFSIAAAGCNLACLNCQNWTISQSSPADTRNWDLMPEEVVKSAIESDCSSIAYTYSEPVTFYEYVYDTATLAAKSGIKNIIVSNGYINEKPLRHLARVIDGANIDLKVFNESKYLKLSGGKLQPVLDSLRVYLEEGVWLEITNLIIPGWSDDPEEIKEMCRWLVKNGFDSVPLHFSRFQPQYKLQQLPPTPVDTLTLAMETALSEGMKYVYLGNLPGSGVTNTVCPSCGKDVIERRGYTVTGNNLKEGKCIYCDTRMSGIWE